MRSALLLLSALLAWSAPLGAMDEYNRIIRLEQDVRDLERQVSTLQREVRELRQRGSYEGSRRPAAAESEAAPTSDTWLSAERWKRIRVGSSEMEVIAALGPPTSMRAQNGRRVLLYAMEIGSSGFLSGSVTLEDRAVVEIEMPVLK